MLECGRASGGLTPEARVVEAGVVVGDGEQGHVGRAVHGALQRLAVVHRRLVEELCNHIHTLHIQRSDIAGNIITESTFQIRHNREWQYVWPVPQLCNIIMTVTNKSQFMMCPFTVEFQFNNGIFLLAIVNLSFRLLRKKL